MLQEAIEELEAPGLRPRPTSSMRPFRDTADALFISPRHVVVGNPKGDVTFVEFFRTTTAVTASGRIEYMMALMKAIPNLSRAQGVSSASTGGLSMRPAVGAAVRMQDNSGRKYLEFHQKLLTGRGQVAELLLRLPLPQGSSAST